jgi:hypothetical protein
VDDGPNQDDDRSIDDGPAHDPATVTPAGPVASAAVAGPSGGGGHIGGIPQQPAPSQSTPAVPLP